MNTPRRAQVVVHPDIDRALRDGRPIVALETAVLTTGLPRTPLGHTPKCNPPGWDPARPTNEQTVLAMMRAVREAGAVPAVTGVIDGTLVIGLDEQQVRAMAGDPKAGKASVADLAPLMQRSATAGTAVSATLAACATPEAGPIQVMATGGIGGVHRGWTQRPDISADLRQLATTPVCCVCSGAKSILDVPATCEALATLGVPVVGFETDCFPRFYSQGSADLPVAHRADDPAAIADICRTHWQALPIGIGQRSSVLVAQPVPTLCAINADELEQWIADAEATARGGAQRTPDVLAAIADRSGGQTLEANIALLVNNAALAARIAVALAMGTPRAG